MLKWLQCWCLMSDVGIKYGYMFVCFLQETQMTSWIIWMKTSQAQNTSLMSHAQVLWCFMKACSTFLWTQCNLISQTKDRQWGVELQVIKLIWNPLLVPCLQKDSLNWLDSFSVRVCVGGGDWIDQSSLSLFSLLHTHRHSYPESIKVNGAPSTLNLPNVGTLSHAALDPSAGIVCLRWLWLYFYISVLFLYFSILVYLYSYLDMQWLCIFREDVCIYKNICSIMQEFTPVLSLWVCVWEYIFTGVFDLLSLSQMCNTLCMCTHCLVIVVGCHVLLLHLCVCVFRMWKTAQASRTDLKVGNLVMY